jgi:hypothetical protein
MVALANILSGSWIENQWFPPDAIDRTRNLRIYPGGTPVAHSRYFDKVKEPATCSLERNFLNHDGRVERFELIMVECDEYWETVGHVARFFDARGFLPVGALDLSTLIDFDGVEWSEEK